MKIENLFPVQKRVIPYILDSCKDQSIYPNDLCVLAPTGSGKTLTKEFQSCHVVAGLFPLNPCPKV